MKTSLKSIEIQKSLIQIISNNPKTLKAVVAQKALYSNYLHLADFFQDLLNYQVDGKVMRSLLNYCDNVFFDKHYDEIEQIRISHETTTGNRLQINGDLKATLAWFAFEKTTNTLANELGLE